MSVPGVEAIKFTNPMDVLLYINAKWVEKNTDVIARIKDKPGRAFSEGIKNIDDKIHKEITDSYFQKNENMQALRKQFEDWKTPLEKDNVQTLQTFFEKLDKELTDDPRWDEYWDNIQKDKQLSDPEVEKLKEDVLASHRFKFGSMVTQQLVNDSIKKPTPDTTLTQKEISNISALIQNMNGAYQRAESKTDKTPEALFKAAEENQKFDMVKTYVTDINNEIVAQAKNMLKEGKDQSAIEKMIDEKRSTMLEKIKTESKFPLNFGAEKAKEAFDAVYSTSEILVRAKNYQEVSKKLGFDVEDRVRRLESLKEMINRNTDQTDLVASKNKNAIADYINVIRNSAYFNFNAKGMDELKPELESEEKILEMQNEIEKIIDTYSPAFKEIETKLFQAAQQGNFEELKKNIEKCPNVLALNEEGQTFLEVANNKLSQEQMNELVKLTEKQPKNEETATDKQGLKINEVLGAAKNINQKNVVGLTKLQLAVINQNTPEIKELIKNGADLKVTTTNYARNFGDKLKDAFSGFPKSIKNMIKDWKNPKPRDVVELAGLSGQTNIMDVINKSVQEAKLQVLEENQKIMKENQRAMMSQLTNLSDVMSKFTQKTTVSETVEKKPEISKVFELGPQPIPRHLTVEGVQKNPDVKEMSNLIKEIDAKIVDLEDEPFEGSTREIALLKVEKETLRAVKNTLLDCLAKEPEMAKGSDMGKQLGAKISEELDKGQKAREEIKGHSMRDMEHPLTQKTTLLLRDMKDDYEKAPKKSASLK